MTWRAGTFSTQAQCPGGVDQSKWFVGHHSISKARFCIADSLILNKADFVKSSYIHDNVAP